MVGQLTHSGTRIQGRIMDTLDDWTVDTQRGTVDIYRGAVITQRDSGHTE